jgi:polysaccharide biosynthesis/export protein
MEGADSGFVHNMSLIKEFLSRALALLSLRGFSRAGMPALLLLPLLAATGCAPTRGGNISYEPPAAFTAGEPDAPTALTNGANYRIATGDLLAITVFRVEDLSKEYRVDLAGNIAFPLIGDVNAVGRTTAELRTDIATRLGQRYLRNPDVTVSVRESTSNNITVEGGVRRPGLFPVTGPLTLIRGVAMAGGIDPQQGNARRLAIFRQIQGQRMAAAFDLVAIRRGEMPDPQIYPGDVIVVESNTRRGLLQDILSGLPLIALFRPF